MSGNVWEWVDSWYDEREADRVLRGGSWSYGQVYVRAASRSWFKPASRFDNIGFRVALSAQ